MDAGSELLRLCPSGAATGSLLDLGVHDHKQDEGGGVLDLSVRPADAMLAAVVADSGQHGA